MTSLTPLTLSHILVPLDGSRLAEAVLPAVSALAQRLHARVTLIHILEERPPATVHGERHLADADEACDYLGGIADALRADGIVVDTHTHDAPEGDLAGSLIAHAEEYAPDLLVLCAHGRGGVRGLLVGGIAQQVLKRGTRPVLMLQPTRDGGPPPFDVRRILVPLGGKHSHEVASEAALTLAQAFGAEMELASVVPTLGTLRGERAATGVLLPTATRAILDLDEKEAAAYVTEMVERIRSQGVAAHGVVVRGEVVAALLETADRLQADLLVMVSHGRAGLDAYFQGSVTPRVAARAARPILLVPEER